MLLSASPEPETCASHDFTEPFVLPDLAPLVAPALVHLGTPEDDPERTPLGRYLTLQRTALLPHAFTCPGCRKAFNGFYRVRRRKAWQRVYHAQFRKHLNNREALCRMEPQDAFRKILTELADRLEAKGLGRRLEASFAPASCWPPSTRTPPCSTASC